MRRQELLRNDLIAGPFPELGSQLANEKSANLDNSNLEDLPSISARNRLHSSDCNM